MTYIPSHTITFLVGPDKASAASRYERGVAIASQAPTSVLYTQHADLKSATDELVKDNASLKTLIDAYTNAEAALKVARTTLVQGISTWDDAYSVFVTLGEKYSETANDAHTLGAAVRGKSKNPLAPPLAVLVTFNATKNLVRVHVKRAPGMKVVSVDMSPDPITATSWVELPGTGAIHNVANPAKGTLWFRACSKIASAVSDFTTPVSVIVK